MGVKVEKIKKAKKGFILKNWFRQHSFAITIYIAIGGILFTAYIWQDTKKSDEVILQEIKSTKSIVLGEDINWQGDYINVADFDEFTHIGDIRFSKDNKILSLGYSNFAYFLSNKQLSEHATIKTKFTPLTEASDYYIIVENVFQVIIGDGDRRAVSLKSFVGGGDWEYRHPVNRPEDLPPRYYLKDEFPIGNAVITEIDVNAKVVEGNTRSVKLDIRFSNENGDVYNTLDSENITWEFVVENSPNDVARYGVGLIDPSAQHKPKVKFEYLYVEEKQRK